MCFAAAFPTHPLPMQVGRMMKIAAMYPKTSLIFGYPQKQDHFAILTPKDPASGMFNIFDTDLWTHMCLSYDKETSNLRYFKVSKWYD